MKKLALLSFMMFSLAGMAQKAAPIVTKLATSQTATSKGVDIKKVESNLAEMTSVLSLTEPQKEMFKELFTTKYRLLNEAAGASDERKEIIYQTIARKLEASLPNDQYEKLKANQQVFHNLTH
ncbi:hypothetical protein [Flavobacterium sp.]|uniref:hypothetical protein n=1 Tax=Flavobacterium sp. TaxID=239 RepID=UPI002628AB5C|nr:hypothetical protein [Flavobacterium sp.]